MSLRHNERHRTERIGWLRAAVLGANDGVVSTASLVLGVAAAHGTRSNVLVAGVGGRIARHVLGCFGHGEMPIWGFDVKVRNRIPAIVDYLTRIQVQ